MVQHLKGIPRKLRNMGNSIIVCAVPNVYNKYYSICLHSFNETTLKAQCVLT